MHTVYTPLHWHHDPRELSSSGYILADGEPFVSQEVPQRAEAIREAITAARLGPVVPPDDQGLEPILRVHAVDYVEYLREAFSRYAAYVGSPCPIMSQRGEVDPTRAEMRPPSFPALREYYTYDYEDPILAGTWEAAYWSAQCALTAATLVRNGHSTAYALCRPPGHHATADQYGGFCYLNNAAVAARMLSDCGPVAVLDVDYHHGNGTQSIFYTDPGVMYVSIHADPALEYPFHWGFRNERGEVLGLGTNVNLPLPLGADDAAYLAAVDTALEHISHFGTSYLVVSMGLDALAGDTIGEFRVTQKGWAEVGRRVAALMLPTVIVQEGGYQLASLGQHAVQFLSRFVERSCGEAIHG